MNLHDNQSLFAAAVQFASRNKEDGGLGIKPIFIEKDYWICRSLKFLSDSEVSGKAVDGFNLLSNVQFLDSDFTQLSGRLSPWGLLTRCFSLLELNLSISD